MKKHMNKIYIAVFLLGLILLSACGGNTTPNEQTPIAIVTYLPHEFSKTGRFYFHGDISNLPLLSPDVELPPEWPIFVDYYPIGHGGPLFYTGPATQEIFRTNLAKFLGIIYNVEDVSGFNIEPDPSMIYGALYYIGETRILSRSFGISASGADEFGLLG